MVYWETSNSEVATVAGVDADEDDAARAVELGARVQALGYEVCASVADGRRAVAVAAEVRPDLVLVELGLSGAVSGPQAAERIGRELDVAIVYVVVDTDAAVGGLLRQAAAGKPFGYVLRPVASGNCT